MFLKSFASLNRMSWSKALRQICLSRPVFTAASKTQHTQQYRPVHEKLLAVPCCGIETNRRWLSAELTETELTDNEYEAIADETLDSLSEAFEDLPDNMDCDPDFDVLLGNGVLTVQVNNSWGTYVINKQSPNKQIWFSSPLSGPKRFDFIKNTWIYKHDGQILHDILSQELSDALKKPVDFTICSYGKPSE